MAKGIEVVCVGDVVVDIVCSPLPHVPAAGEPMRIDEIRALPGGCAQNTAIGLTRLGVKTGVVSNLTDDLYGGFLQGSLQELGIDASHAKRVKGRQTSKTLVIPVVGEDRRYMHQDGVDDEFSGRDLDPEYVSQARVLHIASFLHLRELTAESLIPVLEQARGRGCRVCLDVIICDRGAQRLEECKQILPHVDYFFPNDDEGRVLTGLADPLEQAMALREWGAGTVVLTLGGRGLIAVSGDERLRMSAYTVPVVDPSGAGDAFAAGFITGLAKGWALEQCLKFASAVAGFCVSASGCTDGIVSFEESLARAEQEPIECRRI